MRVHANHDHFGVDGEQSCQVNEEVMKESNSAFCSQCRKIFRKTSAGLPWSHAPCAAKQPVLADGIDEQSAEAQHQGGARAEDESFTDPSQTFAVWMKSTTAAFRDFNAATARNDSSAQQEIMHRIITAGSKRVRATGTEWTCVQDPADEVEFARLLAEAKEVADKTAADAAPSAPGDKETVDHVLRIVRHLEKGEISAARRVISQAGGLREATLLNIQQLKKTYYPQERPEAADIHPSPPPPAHVVQAHEFTIEEVTAYLLPRKAKSPDALGWTARGLLAILGESSDIVKAVLVMLRMIMGGLGVITEPILQLALLTFLGHCIPKGTSEIRPACSPSLFLQMAISIVLRKYVKKQRELIGNGQVGIALPAGGEAYARAAQLEYEFHTHAKTEDYVIITLDAKNFYNSIDKAACRNAGQTLEPIAAVAQLVYSHPAIIHYGNKTSKTAYRVEVPNGTIQGLSISGFCAAKALNDVVSLVRADHPRVRISSFHDDGRISGVFKYAIKAYDDLVIRLRDMLGCSMNAKTGILVVDEAGLMPSQLAAIEARGIPPVDGIVQAGIPIGPELWIRSQLNKTVDEIRSSAASVVGVYGKHDRLRRQALTNVVRLTTTSSFTHLTRCVAPAACQDSAKCVDRIAVSAALSTAGLGHVDPRTPRVATRACLPTSCGGAGLGSEHTTRDAAYIGSFSATAKVVSTLVGPETKFLPSLPLVQELDRALKRVRAKCRDIVKKNNAAEMAVLALTVDSILDPAVQQPEHLQATISTMLYRATRNEIVRELQAADRGAELRSFLSCGGIKAGNWVATDAKHPNTRMDDAQFTIAYALRLGVEPFADIKPGHKCGACGKEIGLSTSHGALCTRGGLGTTTRNERHYALNAQVSRSLKRLDPSTRVRFEPWLVQHFHKQPHNWKQDSKRRADLHIRTDTENYIIDTSLGLAAAASAPAAANTKAGVVARKLAEDKVVYYTSTFKNLKRHEIIPFCAEGEGALDIFAFKFLQRRIEDGWVLNASLPRSVLAAEIYAAISVSIQRSGADGVLNWRYSEFGKSIHDSAADPVHAALNSSPIDIAECDRDLRRELRAHGDSDSEVAAALAAPPAAADADVELRLDIAVGAVVAEAVAAVGEPEPAL